jgi:hypothetical protein
MKEYLEHKNIVYMIDDIFWHMPCKNPTHAEKVLMFILQYDGRMGKSQDGAGIDAGHCNACEPEFFSLASSLYTNK